MSGYTIEDIDVLRRKSGISYQEAIALLEYHNGDLVQALVDLERNGKLRKEEEEPKKKNSILNILHHIYCMRLIIRKDDVTVANLSIAFCLICLIFATYLTIFACILSLILGYRFAFLKHDRDFDGTDIQKAFQHAADNVKSSLGGMAKGFSDSLNATEKSSEKSFSFYDQPASNQASSSQKGRPTPRRVDSQDGSVHFEEDPDGYSSATIE